MATRVSDWVDPYGGRVERAVPVVESHVDAGSIDAAITAVTREFGLSSEVVDGLKRLMSVDHTSSVAQAYYGALAHKGYQATQLRAVKKTMVIPYSLTQAESDALAAYAPDFKLSFRNTDSHDHAVYAAQRMIDQVICESRVPPGCTAVDLGGSLVHHASQGNLHWHVCSPELDRKDVMRNKLRELRLKRMSTDMKCSPETREYSQRVLAGDGQLSCGLSAQECRRPADSAVAVHVYDIPMQDWPVIMENKQLRLVEGCMLFSNVVLEKNAGVFPSAGVRYECDAASDQYNMGFVQSPSWWYSHSLRAHLRYGVDQILYGKQGVYSYKIVERRADTIFFRILRVGSNARPNTTQVYKLPGVAMVKVTGLEVTTKLVKDRVRSTWHWPQPLWDAMVTSALDRLEKHSFSVEEQFNKYRSIAPRQTVNSVRVSGGHQARIDDRVALVVYSTLEAAVMLVRQRLVFDTMAAHQHRERRRERMSGFAKLLSSIVEVTCEGYVYACSALQRAVESLTVRNEDLMVSMYSVAPCVSYRMMPAELVLAKGWFSASVATADSVLPDFREHVRRAAPADYLTAAYGSAEVASVLVSLYGDDMPEVVRKQAGLLQAASVVDDGPQGLVGSQVDSASVTVVDQGADSVPTNQIVLAIEEAIQETQLEAGNVEASCSKFRDECMIMGEPDRDLLVRKKDEMLQPDFWYVTKGVISHSVLGRSGDDFDYSGILLSVPTVEGSFVHPVSPVVFDGMSKGKHVVVEHATVADATYTGWGFTNSALSIYNGPEIVNSLRQALKVARPLKVVMCTGPAGCGKTTQIVARVRTNNVVLCPAKASVKETRDRLRSTRPDLSFPVMQRCKTADSYLVHVLSSPTVRALRADVLLGDEAFMMRSGRWYACALLLGAERLDAFGDPMQIPHVPRALCPALHLRLTWSELDESHITYRCPHDAVAAVGDIYGWRVRSASKVVRSLAVLASVDSEAVEPGCVMLCMYQDDKKTLATKYAGLTIPIRIMTVHEAQGNTFEHVRLHRFLRGKNQTNVPDAFDLFQKEPYVLVAMTRHTRTFRYVTQMGQDQVTRRVTQGSSVTRVNAASDVASAGRSVEHM